MDSTSGSAGLDYDYNTAAVYLGCTRRQLERWRRSGRIAAVKLGGNQVRFTREDLDAFVERSRTGEKHS